MLNSSSPLWYWAAPGELSGQMQPNVLGEHAHCDAKAALITNSAPELTGVYHQVGLGFCC